MFSLTPKTMKEVNEFLLRDALRRRGRASQSDLAEDTGLSLTTVAQGLRALGERGEIRMTEYRESSGGRKAAVYEQDPDAARLYAVAVEGNRLDWAIANALGTIISDGTRLARGDPIAQTVEILNDMKDDAFSGRAARAAAAVGIPGAIREGRVITGKFSPAWRESDVQAYVSEKTGLPMVVENDTNAAALGFDRRSRTEGKNFDSLVYVYRNDDGTGAGVLADGRLVRGAARFAGEIGYLPSRDGKQLDTILQDAATDAEYARAYAAALAAVNCVVNPDLCVVGGSNFRFDLSDAIEREFNTLVNAEVRPRLVFEKDTRFYYLSGLCALAEETLFPRYRLESS